MTSSRSNSLLEQLSLLTENQMHVKDTMLMMLQSDSEESISDVINYVKKYSPTFIYALAQNSPELNEFFETHPDLQNHWADILKQLDCPSWPITAFDNQPSLSLFTSFKAVFLNGELQKYVAVHSEGLDDENAMALLNAACTHGLYHAYVKRLTYNLGLLKKADNTNIGEHLSKIFADMEKLNSYYWARGCLQSSLALFSVANTVYLMPGYDVAMERFRMRANHQFSWSRPAGSTEQPLVIGLVEKACVNLYLTFFLAEVPASKRISDCLTEGKGLLAGYENTLSDVSHIQKMVQTKLDDLKLPLPDSFLARAKEQALGLMRQYHPEIATSQFSL